MALNALSDLRGHSTETMVSVKDTNTTKYLVSDRTFYIDKSIIQEGKVAVTKSSTLTSKTVEVTKVNLLEMLGKTHK